MSELPWSTFPGLNPSFVDMERDTRLDTAWSWCLHVRVPVEYGTDPVAVHVFHDAVLQATSLAHTYLTDQPGTDVPAACGGDSYTAWCEPFPYVPEDDLALHVYFGAPDIDAARLAAVGFLTLTGLTTHEVALSTAGDWAEQTAIPEAP